MMDRVRNQGDGLQREIGAPLARHAEMREKQWGNHEVDLRCVDTHLERSNNAQAASPHRENSPHGHIGCKEQRLITCATPLHLQRAQAKIRARGTTRTKHMKSYFCNEILHADYLVLTLTKSGLITILRRRCVATAASG